MKKVPVIFKAIGLLALGSLMILAACSNSTTPTTPSETFYGDGGVVGVVSGMVYDKHTATPLPGVRVSIGPQSTTTGDNGAWSINVDTGTYTVTYSKKGYLIYSEEIYVDAQEYINQDPFAEYEVLTDQIAALNAWIATQAPVLPAPPAFSSDSGGDTESYQWQYQDGGYFVNGDGTVVQVTNNTDGTFKFELSDKKLEYTTFHHGYSVFAVGLEGLTGAIQGKLMAFYETNANYLTVKLAEAVPVQADTQIYFKATNYEVGDVGDDTVVPPPGGGEPTENTDLLYGPAIIDAEGNFSFSGLPVNRPLQVIVNSFTQDGWYFSKETKVYEYVNNVLVDTTLPGANEITLEQNSAKGSYTDVGTLYVFTEGSYAVVKEYSADIREGGDVTLTFNKAMDPARFSATYTPNTNVEGIMAAATIALAVTWDAEYLVATLKPVKTVDANKYVNAVFPYSTDGTQTVGTIDIIAGSKAKDGSPILNEGVIINLLTPEAITLKNVEVNPEPADIPARALVSGNAIKLTFTKDVAELAYFEWEEKGSTNNVYAADYAPAGTDGFYVYVDQLKADGTKAYNLKIYVSSKDDPADAIGAYGTGKGRGDIVSMDFSKTPVDKLILASTNLYANRVDTAAAVDSAAANYPVAAPITLTFTRNVPADVKVNAVLVKESLLTGKVNFDQADNSNGTAPHIANQVSVTGLNSKTLRITPTNALLYGTEYVLGVQILKGDQVIFDLSTDTKGLVALEADGIVTNAAAFTTTENILVLKKSNIFVGADDQDADAPDGTNENFPVDSDIELYFATDIPDNAKITARLVETSIAANSGESVHSIYDSLPLAAVRDATDKSKLVINPTNNLKSGTQYDLSLEIRDGNKIVFDGQTGSVSADVVSVDISETYAFIQFTTAKSAQLKLVSTNLYPRKAGFIGRLPSTVGGTNIDKFLFTPGNITLTFDKDIPAGAIVKASILKNGGPFNDYNDTIAFTSATPAGKVLTINPAASFEYDQAYELRVKVSTKITDEDEDVIFDTDKAINNSQVIYNIADKAIEFLTVEDPADASTITTARLPANTNGTSKVVQSVGGDTITFSASVADAKVLFGRTYYVEFDEPITSFTAGTYGVTAGGAVYDTDLEMVLGVTGANLNVLSIRVNWKGAAVDIVDRNGVTLATGVPPVPGLGGTTTDPKINTTSGDLKIIFNRITVK